MQAVQEARAVTLACFDADIRAYAERVASRPDPARVVDRLYAKQRQTEASIAKARRAQAAAELAQVKGTPSITGEAQRQERGGNVEDRLISRGLETAARLQIARQREEQDAVEKLPPKPAITTRAESLRRSLGDHTTWSQRREYKLQRARVEKDVAAMEEVTGVPTVNRNSEELAWRARGGYVGQPVTDRLYASGPAQRRKDAEREKV